MATKTQKPERSYKTVDEMIMALQTRYSFDPDKYSISTRVYAGHFFIIQDKDKNGVVNGKAHLIYVPGRVDWIHVFESYDRDLVEQMALWLTEEGPFTNVETQIVGNHNQKHGNRSYFSKANTRGFGTIVLTSGLYAGRFFITHDREKPVMYKGATRHHYRVVCTDDTNDNIHTLQPLECSFDTASQAKHWIKRITRYAKPRRGQTDSVTISEVITGVENAKALAIELADMEQ